MSLPFLTEKSWSRATHLKIRVTAVPMTTCHERGKNMNAVWPGFVANVAGRHFLHRFEFRALAAVLCQFVLDLFAQAAVLHTSACLRSAGVIDADVPGLVHALAEAKF